MASERVMCKMCAAGVDLQSIRRAPVPLRPAVPENGGDRVIWEPDGFGCRGDGEVAPEGVAGRGDDSISGADGGGLRAAAGELVPGAGGGWEGKAPTGGSGRTNRLLRYSTRPLGSFTRTSRRCPSPTMVPRCSQRRESGCCTATREPSAGDRSGLLWRS